MKINEFLSLLHKYEKAGDGYKCQCPAHEDNKSSLSVKEENGKMLLHCFAGCTHIDIVRSLGISEKDLFDGENFERSGVVVLPKKAEEKPKAEPKEVKVYPALPYTYRSKVVTKRYEYKNADGEVIYVVLRTEAKDFPVYTKVENGWITGRKCLAVPYKFPELIKAINEGETIYIVEGEKDVETLMAHGFTATTAPGGGGTWFPEFNKYFRDSIVVLIPDNDPTGLKQVKNLTDNLGDLVKSIRVVKLPVQNEKEDVTDWFQFYGGTADSLKSIVAGTEFHKNKAIERVTEEIALRENIENLENLRDYLHMDGTHRIIPLHFCTEMLNRWKLAVSRIGKQRKYFIYKEGFWQEISTDLLSTFIYDWFTNLSASSENIEKVLNLLPSLPGVSVKELDWDSNDDLINLNNCTFDFSTMTAREHDPKDRFTYKLPFDYDPEAICPTFDDSLWDYSCHDKSWINAFWEIAGYAMYGHYPFQKMFWFTGKKGRNGKGTCIRIIETLVGEKYTMSDIDTRDFREKFYKSRLIGKRLATAGDLHNRLANVASLKQLTGGDRQTTDIKFGDAKSFVSKAKFVFAMNQLPMLPPDENIAPIAKRISILPFDYEIRNPDQTVEEKIYGEMSGIFNKAVAGLKRLLDQRAFTTVKRGEEVLEQYQNKVSSIDAYLSNIVYDDSLSEGLYVFEIFEHYTDYMRLLYGDNWVTDKDVMIRNSQTLISIVRTYFADKGIKLESDGKWHKVKKSTLTHYPMLRFKNEQDTINEFTSDEVIDIEDCEFSEVPEPNVLFPLKDYPDF